MKLELLKRPYPQNRQQKLIYSNFMYKILLKINPLKRNLLKNYPPKRIPENNEISINYISTRKILDINKIVVDNIFSFKVTFDITRSNDDIKPQTVKEC
jgi:hypothetical protein